MEELKPYVKSGNSITIGVYFWQATVKAGSHMVSVRVIRLA